MIGNRVEKIDSKALVTGKPVYTEDLIRDSQTLTIKLLRSPHAHGEIIDIDISKALKVKGVEAIFTYKDVPQKRYSICAETFPEASPYDRLILDKTVRYIGDEVAIIVAENEKSAEMAMKLIKVDYKILEPILDPKKSLESNIIIHPENDVVEPFPFGLNTHRNQVAQHDFSKGDINLALEKSDVIVEKEYETQGQAHCMMETHRAHAYLDENDNLVILTATQSAFNTRRLVCKALDLPMSKVRVIKPRIGGGFGGKNIALLEMYVAFATLKTRKPTKLIYTRKETFTGTVSRHPMNIKVKIGATKDGIIKAIQMDVLNNTGAYGANGPAVAMECGHNVLPMYSEVDAIKFNAITVYTNLLPGGALRGYGATQGSYALESTMNLLAKELKMDPTELRLKNITHEGAKGGILHSPLYSCKLKECIERGKELINWEKEYPYKEIGNGKITSVGMSISTHGSGIAGVDTGSVTLKMEEDGSFNLLSGSSDLGTGSDTILAQIACEELGIDINKISVLSGDTKTCPYDKGAYASSTTFVSGNAVLKAAKKLKNEILEYTKNELKIEEELDLKDGWVISKESREKIKSLEDIGQSSVSLGGNYFSVTSSYCVTESPKPFLAGFVKLEIDKNTGERKVLKYVAVGDSGQIINPNLARIQAEGGITQGIGLALFEDVKVSSKGQLLTNNFMQYKVPAKRDIGDIVVEFVDSYEKNGPFGAKSLGEIVVHTPAPAISGAILNGLDIILNKLPMTSEDIFMEYRRKNGGN